MYVAVVGINGAGKTAFCEAMRAEFGKGPLPVRFVSQPHRRALLKKRIATGAFDERTAFTIDRARLYDEVIDVYRRRQIVVSDRSWLCTAVYQAKGSEARAWSIAREQAAMFGTPDLWVYLDCSVQTALDRRAKQGRLRDIPTYSSSLEDNARLYQSLLQIDSFTLSHDTPTVFIGEGTSPANGCTPTLFLPDTAPLEDKAACAASLIQTLFEAERKIDSSQTQPTACSTNSASSPPSSTS